MTESQHRRGYLLDALVWLALACTTLAVLWPLGLTNRILAGVDALTYFTPYWAYRMAELRAGHIPLWNPYLFLGVPFLANLQSAVLYPLHLPLTWLRPENALVWSALLHAWLAAGFTYTFGRRSLGLSRPAATLSGLLFGLGGFTVARVENINQLNTLAWLPALFWLLDETARACRWRGRIRWGTMLTIAVALQILAGHTQSAFVNLVGLGLYAVYPWLAARVRVVRSRRSGATHSERRNAAESAAAAAPRMWALVAVVPALLLCAAQLVPSIELNGLGLRMGGLSYRQAVSFSLHPRLLAQSLLPPFGGGLAEAFASEGYAEFTGYVGIAGLALAVLGAASLRRNHRGGGLVLLVVVGIALALGGYTPLYYPLWRLVPGFAMFRAPARWLALYVLGIASLAGMGLDAWPYSAQAAWHPQGLRSRLTRLTQLVRRSRWRMILCVIAGLALLAIAAYQQWPHVKTLAGWAAAGVMTLSVLWLGRRRPRLGVASLMALVLVELWLSGRALPFAQATAPQALGLRNAPAALLAATANEPDAGRDRFLSMSDIRFDPGDLAELRDLQSDRLPPESVELMVRSTKQMEVIAPNLSLLLRLPAIDGYDGGMLPLGRYGRLQGLFLPPDQLLADGRLREQLRQIPAGRLLDLTGVRFIITDKQNDLWAGDVYYDLEQAAVLAPGETLTLNLADYPVFSATGLGIVSYVTGTVPPDGTAIAEISVQGTPDQAVRFDLRTGFDTAVGPGAPGNAPIARAWPEQIGAEGHDYLARLAFPQPLTPVTITLRVMPNSPAWLTVRGASLIDDLSGTHASITISPRGDFRRIQSGDVKVYERMGAPGRAWLVHGVRPAADDTAALTALSDPAFDPRTAAIITGSIAPRDAGAAAEVEKLTVRSFDAEQVVLHAEATSPALLVLADADYPGWQATVDGVPVPILRANLMFRAVSVPAGTHDIVFAYRSAIWRLGMGISLAMCILILGALGLSARSSRQ